MKTLENHSEIRHYAFTNSAELFAVLSEHLFENPKILYTDFPEIYYILQNIYNLDTYKVLFKNI